MAMKTASPWWFSLLFASGLLLTFLGERPFNHIDSVRLLFTGAGLGLALIVTALRIWIVAATSGDRRKVERVLLLCQGGALLAILLYSFTTEGGRAILGLAELEGDTLDRYIVPMNVLWTLLMVVSLTPILMVEASLGTARRHQFSLATMKTSEVAEEAVEAFRVRDMAASGLTIALAAGFLMVTCNIAEQRNIRWDVSYFKTSSPGESTRNIVANLSEPVKALLFFPEVNQVKNEVIGYLTQLQQAGGKVTIEEHDRLVSAQLAKKYTVRNDGAVVFVHKDKHESIKLTADPERSRRLAARMELRELDQKVNTALIKVVRTRRIAYMTVGHGELNDAENQWGTGTGSQTNQLKQVLRSLNYDTQDLGLFQGLGTEVPDDAEIVMLLAPKQPLPEEMLAALDRYMERGGKMFIVLDPLSIRDLGVLGQRLGVRFSPAPVTDDKNFIARRRNRTDHRLIVTNRFLSHPTTTTVTRSMRQGILMINAGTLESTEQRQPRRVFPIRSMNDSFIDLNNNFRFDEGTEQRRQYHLAAAIESEPDNADDSTAAPQDQGDGGDGSAEAEVDKDTEPMRALVFADADMFIDIHQLQFPILSQVFADGIKWLGGEEYITGEIKSEKDVRIQHTKDEDELWFYGIIVGAPLLVLVIGVILVWWRRVSVQRRA